MSFGVHDCAKSIASVERREVGWRGSSRIAGGFTFTCARRTATQMNESTPTPEPRSGQGMDYSEIADVQDVHAAVQREKREPRVGREPLSIWLIAVYGLAVFFGGAYLGRYSGNFSGEALDPYGGEMPTMKKVAGPQGAEQAAELSPRDRGKKVFAANCQTCHQANGLGVAGQYPPLAGSEFTTG